MTREAEQIATAFATHFFRLHRLMDRRLNQAGLSFARFKFLMFLKNHGTSRASDIAEMLGLAPRTVTEGLDGLERDGLIRRDPDPDDRRAKRVSLTPAGDDAVAASEPVRDRIVDGVIGSLSAADKAAMLAVFDKIDANLTAEEAREGLHSMRPGETIAGA